MLYKFYSVLRGGHLSIIVATHCGCWSVGGAGLSVCIKCPRLAGAGDTNPAQSAKPASRQQQCVKTTRKPAAACPSRRLLRPRARTRPLARVVMCNIPHSGVYTTLAKHFTQSSKKMRMKGDE